MKITPLTSLPSYVLTAKKNAKMLESTQRRVFQCSGMKPARVYGVNFTTETEEERENLVTKMHTDVWGTIVKTRTPAVIFEDDAWATKELPIIKVNWERSDLLLLGGVWATISNLYFDDFSRLASSLGTFAYVVTPPAAEILLKRPERVCDHITRAAIQTGELRGYLFTPPLFVTLPHPSGVGTRAPWERQHQIRYRGVWHPLKRPNPPL